MSKTCIKLNECPRRRERIKPAHETIYELTYYLKNLYSLPCLVAAFLAYQEIGCRYSLIPIALTIFPLIVFICDNCKYNTTLDILIIGNVIFLSAFATHYGSEYGVTAAIVYSVIYLILRVPCVEDCTLELMFMCGTAVFCVLAMLTLECSEGSSSDSIQVGYISSVEDVC